MAEELVKLDHAVAIVVADIEQPLGLATPHTVPPAQPPDHLKIIPISEPCPASLVPPPLLPALGRLPPRARGRRLRRRRMRRTRLVQDRPSRMGTCLVQTMLDATLLHVAISSYQYRFISTLLHIDTASYQH